MSAQHTPGPWRARRTRATPTAHVVLADEDHVVAVVARDVEKGFRVAEDAANARLIAAAPDLLAASIELLSVALDCQSRWSRGHPDRVDRAKAVIERALGRPLNPQGGK